MREPTFIVAGGVATGTGSLTTLIKDHPQIYLPKVMRPECGFFYKEAEFKKGKKYYLQRWFSEVGDEIAIGERSSLNLHGYFNNVAQRTHALYPDIKLIFCLRNPTERAWGNYRFTALCGLETLSFAEALEQEEARINRANGWMSEIRPHEYRKRGCYYDQLESFYEHFPKEQILCIKSETLAQEPEKILYQVFNFLGVDTNFAPKSDEKNFSSPNVKNLNVQAVLRSILGRRIDEWTEEYREGQARSIGSKLLGYNLTRAKQPMLQDDRQRLNDFYAPHNEKLSKFLGWDLSDWN
ncbi:sulfotransferase [Candidatus Peregrinibacteria bacterium CG11_big_fil_rev_8_21_14_0_20_46_8]|nr:MAG: sulfotransferase [Candidatus Peregrinibacteria bacterium CG11_big_fil_rev_8_21_14_0_20_46_8]